MKPGIIVLDGPDASGKTTLAQALIERYEGQYLHATYRFRHCMHLYHLALLRLAAKHLEAGRPVVIDRWWPSEMIYGDVYREGKRVPNEGLRILHRLALRYGVVYVICYRDSRERLLEEYARLHKVRDEMYAPDQRMMQIHDHFKQLYESVVGQQSRWLRYNVDRAIASPAYFETMVEMIGDCSRIYTTQYHLTNETLAHSVGSPLADYVMVGERIRPVHRCLDYPWIAFKGSSLNVGKSLGELGVPEHRLLWTNAYLPNGEPNAQLAELLGKPFFKKVVAMGDVATKFCKGAGKCDFSMPHPAYLTRFTGQDSLTRVLGQIFT